MASSAAKREEDKGFREEQQACRTELRIQSAINSQTKPLITVATSKSRMSLHVTQPTRQRVVVTPTSLFGAPLPGLPVPLVQVRGPRFLAFGRAFEAAGHPTRSEARSIVPESGVRRPCRSPLSALFRDTFSRTLAQSAGAGRVMVGGPHAMAGCRTEFRVDGTIHSWTRRRDWPPLFPHH